MTDTKSKALICGFIMSVLFSVTGFCGKCDSISTKIFRLHIIANSNSQKDQDLKLKVRDRILKEFGSQFSGKHDIYSAEELTAGNIADIKNSVQNEIAENGYNYAVDVKVANSYFNTRVYNEITLPAGYYDSLKVVIGEGEGKNWWCVMFPPMCIPAAAEREELRDVLSPSELEIVSDSPRYMIRFKIIEIFMEVRSFVIDNLAIPLCNVCAEESSKIHAQYEINFKIAEIFEAASSYIYNFFN